MAPQPRTHTHAPSGARNPQNETALAFSSAVPRKVVWSASSRPSPAGDQSSTLNEKVCRRPERVAADGHVPRDVPEQADDDHRRGGDDSVDVPGPGEDDGPSAPL